MKPLVSAVILTHNRKQLVMRAIDSVLSQTYPNMECIVVDDASMDGTKEFLSAHEDIKYVYISKGESRGGNYARNMGIKASKGEYVAFLDDDDYWLPSKIEKQYALIEKKHCDVVYCGMRPEFVAPDGSIRYEDWPPHEGGEGDLSKRILTKIYTTTSAILVKKKALEDVGLFDENLRFWQEYELTMRLAQISEIYAVSESLFVYRIDNHDVQRLTNKYEAWLKSVRYIHRKHKQLYKNLSMVQKIDAIRMWHSEAYGRAQKIGLKHEMLKHRLICAFMKRVRLITTMI